MADIESASLAGLEWLASTGDGVWVVDTSQRIVFWNQAAQALLGYSPGEALGKLCFQLIAGRNPRGEPLCQADCSRIRLARGRSPIPGFEMMVSRQDGKRLRVGVTIIVPPPGSENGQLAALVHIFHPIVEATAPPPSLRIQLLGYTNVWFPDGSLVTGPNWQKRKVRVLLAFLAFQRGRPAHRQVLIEALWPDLEYAAALHNLNTIIHYLRKSLEPALRRGPESRYIHYEDNCYFMSGDPSLWLDVEAFEAGVARARREPVSEQALLLYRQALTLYQGDLLADLGAATAWCAQERERLRSLYLDALEEAGSLYEQKQEIKQANEMYWKALSTDPCRESACQRLMRLAAARQDRAAVINLYHCLVAALDREIGAHPTSETVSIYKAATRSF